MLPLIAGEIQTILLIALAVGAGLGAIFGLVRVLMGRRPREDRIVLAEPAPESAEEEPEPADPEPAHRHKRQDDDE